MKILLVEPNFPIPSKSRNHKNFLPIGLLKLHDYYRNRGESVKLVRGNRAREDLDESFEPDWILVTSLFTYWSEYVWEAVKFYRDVYPRARISIGGVYASLMGRNQHFVEKLRELRADVFIGVHKGAEEYASRNPLNYSILDNSSPVDYQIVHASRGCTRRCGFCGTWLIEPRFEAKESIKNELAHRKLIFYDNNLLANPQIDHLLDEIIGLKKEGKIDWCESQSGFDARIIRNRPRLATKLKQAGFRAPRIAWDGAYSESDMIRKEIDILVRAGYKRRDIMIFMIYNWQNPFGEMEKKRVKCWKWRVQVSDCRYRPLDQLFDNYNPHRKDQTNDEYYIHEESGWTDALVKQFRMNVRRQNICVRHGFPFYNKDFETMRFSASKIRTAKRLRNKAQIVKYMKRIKTDWWFPGETHYPSNALAKGEGAQMIRVHRGKEGRSLARY